MEAAADVGRNLLQDAADTGSDTAPFFGFIGAASALVFACALPTPPRFTCSEPEKKQVLITSMMAVQALAQHTEPPSPAWVSRQWVYSDPSW